MNTSTLAVLFIAASLCVSGQRLRAEGKSTNCGKNERYNECGNRCEAKCGEGVRPCILICAPPACVCEDNFFRHSAGHCATKDECTKKR